jgi:hypothetical protein
VPAARLHRLPEWVQLSQHRLFDLRRGTGGVFGNVLRGRSGVLRQRVRQPQLAEQLWRVRQLLRRVHRERALSRHLGRPGVRMGWTRRPLGVRLPARNLDPFCAVEVGGSDKRQTADAREVPPMEGSPVASLRPCFA